MSDNRKSVFITEEIYNEVDWSDFYIEVVETSENKYSIYLINELQNENLFFNLSLKEILDDFCELMNQRVWKYWFEKSKWLPVYQMIWPIKKIIEDTITELRVKNDIVWDDLLDLDFVENELIATVSEEEKIDDFDKFIDDNKNKDAWVEQFMKNVSFNEAFNNKNIDDLYINSIYIVDWKLKIMTSAWWNKSIEWWNSEALQIVLNYVESLSKKFVWWENIQELVTFNYDTFKKWMNLIWIHWNSQETKQPVFEEFFTVVWLDWQFNRTTFWHWIKKNFDSEWKITKIQFRA